MRWPATHRQVPRPPRRNRGNPEQHHPFLSIDAKLVHPPATRSPNSCPLLFLLPSYPTTVRSLTTIESHRTASCPIASPSHPYHRCGHLLPPLDPNSPGPLSQTHGIDTRPSPSSLTHARPPVEKSGSLEFTVAVNQISPGPLHSLLSPLSYEPRWLPLSPWTRFSRLSWPLPDPKGLYVVAHWAPPRRAHCTAHLRHGLAQPAP